MNDKYTRGGEFVENLVCDNIIVFANRWLHLANFGEMLNDLQEYYSTFATCDIGYGYIINRYKLMDDRYITSPFMAVDNDKIVQPFSNVTGHGINPFTLYNTRI